jgi:hypothetical protein
MSDLHTQKNIVFQAHPISVCRVYPAAKRWQGRIAVELNFNLYQGLGHRYDDLSQENRTHCNEFIIDSFQELYDGTILQLGKRRIALQDALLVSGTWKVERVCPDLSLGPSMGHHPSPYGRFFSSAVATSSYYCVTGDGRSAPLQYLRLQNRRRKSFLQEFPVFWTF